MPEQWSVPGRNSQLWCGESECWRLSHLLPFQQLIVPSAKFGSLQLWETKSCSAFICEIKEFQVSSPPLHTHTQTLMELPLHFLCNYLNGLYLSASCSPYHCFLQSSSELAPARGQTLMAVGAAAALPSCPIPHSWHWGAQHPVAPTGTSLGTGAPDMDTLQYKTPEHPQKRYGPLGPGFPTT